MKVAFLIHSLEVSGCRYRVLQYLPYFKEGGVETSIHFFKRNWLERLRFYNTLHRYDLLYIHRKLFLPTEFWYIRKRAKKIIFDFDDAIMFRSSGSRRPYSFSRRIKFAYMMRRVDLAISGNEFLKSQVLPYHSRVEIIPTSIDLSRYTMKESVRKEGPVTIGWLGSSSTLKYLGGLMPILEKVYQRYPDLQLKIVCDQFPEAIHVPIIRKAWAEEDEASDLKSFDIGLMPLSDDLWSRGKCGLKILQYYGAGIPVICTPVGANRDIVQDGLNGFWARDEREWEDRLLKLVKEEELRREMGLRGRRTVELSYSLEVNAPRLLNICKKVSVF